MVTIATVDEQIETAKQERELLLKVWAALRGIGMGAPLDMDYAKELAQRINDTFLQLEQ